MGIFDQDNIVIGVESESEPVATGNHEEGQSTPNEQVEAPEANGQAEQSTPEGQGQAEAVNEQPKKLANTYDTEAQLDKGCISISGYLGDNVDFATMTLEQKEQYYLDARRRMSQGNKPQPKQEAQQPQAQLEQKSSELTELKNLLAQALQSRPQQEAPKPVNVWELPDEEFTETLYSNPKATLESIRNQMFMELRDYLAPLDQARREQAKMANWEKTFSTVKSRHDDFDSLVDDMSHLYDENPGLNDLGEAGLEMAYRMAKTQKETETLRQKTLELIEREAQMDAQRIENIKKGAALPGNTNSKPPENNGQLTPEQILYKELTGRNPGRTKGIFDDF